MSDSNPANAQRHHHEDEIDLTRLWGLLVDNGKLIAVMTAVALLVGVAYALLATPIYRADALLQVEKKRAGCRASPRCRRFLNRKVLPPARSRFFALVWCSVKPPDHSA